MKQDARKNWRRHKKKEAPCNEEVYSREEIKGGASKRLRTTTAIEGKATWLSLLDGFPTFKILANKEDPCPGHRQASLDQAGLKIRARE